MTTRLLILITVLHFVVQNLTGQNSNLSIPNDTVPFNYAYWNGLADKQHLTPAERHELISTQRKIHFDLYSHKHQDKDEITWVTQTDMSAGKFAQSQISAGPCTNIDFEAGNMSGWVRSTGYNPLTNVIGCCPNTNGDQTIVTGGTDPFGGFPQVYPGGGSFSLRLGSTATGGIADRISQTFFVTAANANFTYRYAAVLNDGGHPLASQPRFTSEIIDTLGNPVPCTFYQVSAGSGVSGFSTSSLTANGGPVIYKPWTNVLIDLTPNIGQNVTLRFTVYDCGPSGHFAYAYLDGLCTNFATSVADTTCPNVPISICAPAGFSTTTWNGPGFSNDPNQCINAVLPGTYTCTTILIPGCPGPTFTHTLSLLPNPVISFTPISSGPCSKQYTFNANIGISTGSIVSYLWSFGDGATATGSLNPSHTYASPGTYQVKLRALTNRGCMDSLINSVTIFPFPTIAFSPPSNCVNTIIQFTNSTSVSPGSIAGYTWSFGNGVFSNLQNPTNSYTANGTYSINLTAISNQGCSSTLTQTLGIFPPPVISFSANPLCDINGTSFSPSTSTAIASGSLATYYWNFGDGGTSTLANPVHIYNTPGTYAITFSATSNHSCPATTSNTLLISPSPTVAFSTTSVNACTQNFTFTNNSAISSGPISYLWNFGSGNTNTTAASSLSYSFPTVGSYTVSLIGTSNMGCTDTAYQYISIYPYPVINFSVPASCERAIFTVSTTAVSGSVTSYNWNFGDPLSGAANTSTLQNPTHFYSTTNQYTITLNIVSNLNCPSSTIVPITVFPNPGSSFTKATLNNCSLQYSFANTSTVSSIGASSIAAYKWDFGGIASSTLASPGTVSFPSNGTYTTSLIVTTNHNCSDTSVNVVLIHPLPQLSFTTAPVCQNLPAGFAASASISPLPLLSSSINSYTWSFGDNSYSSLLNPPAHSYSANGTYTVSLSATSNMACINTVTQALAIYPIASANFSTTNNLCLGNITTFTSSSNVSSPSVIYSYNWDFGDGSFGSNPSTSHSYTNSNAYQVTFSVTTNNECLTTVTKTVNVYPLPVVNFTVSGGCLNTTSQLSQTTSISSGAIASYSWNFGDGTSIQAQNPPHTYSTAGTFTPTLLVTSVQGCTASTTNSVIIYPLPYISFSSTPVCVNSAMQFVNSSSISLGSLSSYTWSFGDGGSAVNFSPLYTYSLSGNLPVTFTAVSNQGCVNTGSNTAVINPYPTSTLTTINSSCINDLVSFNPNLSITAGSVPSTTIMFGDGAISTYTNPLSLTVAHTYTAYNTYTVTIMANSNANCARTFTSSVIIYPKPFTNFTVTNFCEKDSTQFTNVSIIPTGSIAAHQWQFSPSALSSTLSSPKVKLPATGVYNVNLTEFSYPESGLTCSASVVKQVTINPLPVPVFSNNMVCQGLPTQFNNSTNPQGVIGWTWDFNNDGVADNSQQHPSFVYPAAGNYTAALIAKNFFNCSDTMRKQVTVYANPAPLFNVNNSCLGTLSTFTNNTLAGSGNSTTYTWSANSIIFSTQQNPVKAFSQPGTYQIELTAESDLGCVKKYVAPLIIHYLPSVDFTSSAVCFSASTSFTNLTGILTGSITNWRWDFDNDGVWDDTTHFHPANTYPKSGSFICKLQSTSNNQCRSEITKTVTVWALPQTDFVKTPSLCVNDKITFRNLSTSSDGAIRLFNWDFDNDGIQDSEDRDGSFYFPSQGIYTVNLAVRTQYGCSSVKSGSVYINPKASPNFSSPKHDGCPELCVVFNDVSTIPPGYKAVNAWDFGDGSVGEKNLKDVSHCYKSGNYPVKLTLTTDSGCISSLSYPNYVNVYNAPVPGFVVDPPEVDEDAPVVDIKSTASEAAFTRFILMMEPIIPAPALPIILKSWMEKPDQWWFRWWLARQDAPTPCTNYLI